MESIFSIILIFLTFMFYFSGHKSPINRWCAYYLALSSIGVIKESFLYQIIPWIQSVWGVMPREDICIRIYSVMTWVSYSFASPAAIIMGLHFYGLNNSNPKLLSIIKATICIPALVLSFFYSPLSFRIYQLEDHMFWVIYSIYNLSFGLLIIWLIFKGVRIEKSPSIKHHKITLGAVILPATIYALVTIFVIHPLGLEKWFKAWLWNIVIVLISAFAVLVMAFKNGFLGLKLSVQNYNWDSDMDLIGRGADYTSHMLKNQTSKMELCVEQLKSHYNNEKLPEELAILSRSISALRSYVDRMKRHSQNINLFEEPCNLAQMLSDAMSVSLTERSGISLNISIDENLYWLCDKSHMTEVFTNIITNAVESIHSNGQIVITAEYNDTHHVLQITDTGTGMDNDEIRSMFIPYFTTKSTEKNFGLGLSYCKNVIIKHGGDIFAKSKPGKGTTITVDFPLKRVTAGIAGKETKDEQKD